MKPEFINYKCLLTYPTDYPSQSNPGDTDETKKYIPSGQESLTKKPIAAYSIDQANQHEKLESAACPEARGDNNHAPVRKSNRKRKKKLPFSEQYQSNGTDKSKKEKPKNTVVHDNLFEKYGYLPKGAKRSPQLDLWIEMEEKSKYQEWNVWPKKYKPANCVPHKKIL